MTERERYRDEFHAQMVTTPLSASSDVPTDGPRAKQPDGPLADKARSGFEPPKPVATLDWAAYFKEFCQAHGGSPLLFGGVLLFTDGWKYSAHDYAGPEWPPPTDPKELNELRRWYWLRRRRIVEVELEQLSYHVEALEQMQHARKVPLQQVLKWFDSESRRWCKEVGPLDTTAMKERINWLRDDLTEFVEPTLTELNAELVRLTTWQS